MAKAEQIDIRLRIVIEQPVAGVLHSLQSGDKGVPDPKRSIAGEPLTFDFRCASPPAPNSSAIRCAAKAPIDASSLSASANPPATTRHPGRAE